MPVTEVRFYDTWERLVEWGIWSTRQNGMPRYVSPAQVVVMQNVQQNTRTLSITDDEAMVIDSVLAKLRQRDPEMWRCGLLYFIPPAHTYAQIAAEMTASGRKMTMQRVQTLIQSLVAWVDAACEAQRQESSAEFALNFKAATKN